MKTPEAVEAEKSFLVRLPPELHDAVRSRAGEEDLSMAALVRRALRAYLVGGPK